MMSFQDYPLRPGWMVGGEVPDARGRPPAAPVEGMLALFGLAPGDWEPRIYLVPARITVEEVVEFFEVGSDAALRHGWDERDTADRVSRTLAEVEAIVPGAVEFAAPSGLRFRFARKPRQDEVDAMEAVYYRDGDEFQAGLHRYLDGWSGESLLSELRDSGLLTLAWD